MKISSFAWRFGWVVGAAWLAAACSPGGTRPEPLWGIPVDDAGLEGPTGPASGPGELSAIVGEPTTPEVPAPAISGGTLLVLDNGATAVAADPDRDRVWFADLDHLRLLGGVELRAGDEPGRLVADGAGRVHVALRRGGAVVSIDVASRAIVARRAVCPAPRGIAFDGASGLLHVACAGGELVSLRADGGEPTRTLHLDRDLRDVVVHGDGLLVSRFRDAELLTLDAAGAVTRRVRASDVPESLESRGGPLVGGKAGVAWRTIARGDGVMMLHQRARQSQIGVEPGAYGGGGSDGGCAVGVVQTTVSMLGADAPVPGPTLSSAVLAVDVAANADGSSVALAVPGNGGFANGAQVLIYAASNFGTPGATCLVSFTRGQHQGQVVAVAFTSDTEVLAQTREPATLTLGGGRTIRLSDVSREDSGQRLFHSSGGAFVACASCHPEGGDDGNVWTFSRIGGRRTQNLRGGLAGTAPFHWDGDMATFAQLADEVFVGRMNAGGFRPSQVAALERWTLSQPALPSAAPLDASAAARGGAIFADPTVGCAGCHGGEHLTSNATVDVGTGGRFQVPSLRGVAARTPLLHNGCARTLTDRFGACGGGDSHGHTSQLLPTQLADLVAYLETL